MDDIFSRHALEQLQERTISVQQVEEVLQNPKQITKQAGYTIYQSMIKFESKE